MTEHFKGTTQLRCDCGGIFLVVDKYVYPATERDPKEVDFNFAMYGAHFYDNANTLRSRIKHAWLALTHKRESYADIYIEDPEKVKQFVKELNDLVNSDD